MSAEDTKIRLRSEEVEFGKWWEELRGRMEKFKDVKIRLREYDCLACFIGQVLKLPIIIAWLP